jgi:hypothetical protein
MNRPALTATTRPDTPTASPDAPGRDLSATAPQQLRAMRSAVLGDVVAYKKHPKARAERAVVERVTEAVLYLRMLDSPGSFLKLVRREYLRSFDTALPLWEQSGDAFVYVR